MSDIGSKGMHVMRVLLGIDAAWTDKNPSGIAVATEEPEGWRLKGAFPSVEHFVAEAHQKPAPEKPYGGAGQAHDLLEATRALAGRLPDLVAIDMPMALQPITTRRTSDDALSRAYPHLQTGGYVCLRMLACVPPLASNLMTSGRRRKPGWPWTSC